MKRGTLLLIGGVFGLSTACGFSGGGDGTPPKPIDGFDVDFTDSSATYTATLSVRNVRGEVPSNIDVVPEVGETSQADANGVVTISDLPAQRRITAQITGDEIVPLTVQLTFANSGQFAQRVTVVDETVAAEVLASEGGTVTTPTTTITLPKGGFVDAQGAPYNGGVTVRVSGFNPDQAIGVDGNGITLRSGFNTESIPTGSFSVVDTNGLVHPTIPEAIIDVQLVAADGSPLQLAPGSPATVRFALPSFSTRGVGDRVSMMTFDQDLSMWREQGECEVFELPLAQQADGRTLECVGTVTHFTKFAIGETKDGTPRCVVYQATFTGLPAGIRRAQWVEELPPTSKYKKRAIHSYLYGEGALSCHFSEFSDHITAGKPVSRLVIETTDTDGGKRLFFSSFTTPAKRTVPLTQVQQVALGTGGAEQTCQTCTTVEVAFNYNEDGIVATDADGDYFFSGDDIPSGELDCDDNAATTYPGAPEFLCDSATAVDSNCDGQAPTALTLDPMVSGNSATWTEYCSVCNSDTYQEFPGNANDEDCDGIASDSDGDGFFVRTDPAYAVAVASDPSTLPDCDDTQAQAKPGGQEVLGNDIDEDCDGFALDADDDNYLAPEHTGADLTGITLPAISNEADRYKDCNDKSPDAFPGNTDLDTEHVYVGFTQNCGGQWSRFPGICQYINASTGTLNDAGKALLVDANCDGEYLDLDWDGETAAEGDPNDLDPRVTSSQALTTEQKAADKTSGGDTCDVTNACTVNPCQNGGACRIDAAGDGAHTCNCADGFSGENCANMTPAEICDDSVDNDGDGDTDCDDSDCFQTVNCPSEAGLCEDGIDNDNDFWIDCNDSDCSVTAVCEGNMEVLCQDLIDNDNDNFTDCEDINCFGETGCTSETVCGDTHDNDQDGKIDCADTDCFGLGNCVNEVGLCEDGGDNDNDGLTDCEDSDCDADPACAPETICDDMVDNDNNGDTDCSDANCAADPACTGTEVNCDDNVDNDTDGDIDCADSDCEFMGPCYESDCADSMDNDTDGFTDCDDPDCAQNVNCNGATEAICNDMMDNDLDGVTDCDDSDCFGLVGCTTEANCMDFEDNDSDGKTDCDDSDCAADPFCGGGGPGGLPGGGPGGFPGGF